MGCGYGSKSARQASPPKKAISINPATFVTINKGCFQEFYSIDKKLGKGAFGEVYQCVHKATSSARAVKVWLKEAIRPEEHKDFLNEVAMLKMMDHPNIVKLYEVYEDSMRYYIITE